MTGTGTTVDPRASLHPRSVVTDAQNQYLWPGFRGRRPTPPRTSPQRHRPVLPDDVDVEAGTAAGLDQETSIAVGSSACEDAATDTLGIAMPAYRGEPVSQRSPISFPRGLGMTPTIIRVYRPAAIHLVDAPMKVRSRCGACHPEIPMTWPRETYCPFETRICERWP